MAANKPTIVIGIPCYGDVAPEVVEDWCRWLYHCGRRMTAYNFYLAIKSKTEQFRARNAIVDVARQVGADWLLMLDDDMIVNPWVTQGVTEEYDLIGKLLRHGKDICGALYYQRGGHCKPVLMMKVPETHAYRFLRDDEVMRGLQKVDVAGGGCLLINMRIFDKIPPPYFAPEHEYGTDIQICRKAAEAGFEVWADTSVELGHVRSDRTIITTRNRQQYAMEDPLVGEAKKQIVQADVYTRLVEDVCAYCNLPDYDAIDHDVGMSLFLHRRTEHPEMSDAEWYRLYPQERVLRQVWYNHQPTKRRMTEFILGTITDRVPLEILDFGCGIGITALEFARRGHRVTACDIGGTGTLEFLKWRLKKQGSPMTLHESNGGVPALGGTVFDVVVAMDSIEHVKEWQMVVRELAAHLKPGGVLFSNNAILGDTLHPEHYPIGNGEFVAVCAANHLLPLNQLMYVKRGPKEQADAESADS